MGTFSCTPVFSSTCLVWIILSGLIKGYLSTQDLWSWLQFLSFQNNFRLCLWGAHSDWRRVRLGSWPSLRFWVPPLWEQHLGDILRGEAGSVAGSQQPSCDPETLKTTIINNIPHFLYTKLLQRRLRYHTCLYRIEKKNNMSMMKKSAQSLLDLMEQKEMRTTSKLFLFILLFFISMLLSIN